MLNTKILTSVYRQIGFPGFSFWCKSDKLQADTVTVVSWHPSHFASEPIPM
uniref:Uncharacterized protein n=1 Tax=Arundo donax TaxID=35708 RepID=A0A0A9DUN4_ARUDO